MLVVANNITTRSTKIEEVFRRAQAGGWKHGLSSAGVLMDLAKECVSSGADLIEINVQQHHDSPEAMKFAVEAVQQASHCRLCLSTDKVETLEAGLGVCEVPPLVNYISMDRDKLARMLPLVSRKSASLVLLVSDPAAPADTREMVERAAILVGAAVEAGISNDNIFVDPGLEHVSTGMGQRHLVEVIEFLRSLPNAFDPPVKTTCWLENISAGAPRRLRPRIETALLPMLAALGLSAVFLDVLRQDNARTLRLIRIFSNELVYSDREVE